MEAKIFLEEIIFGHFPVSFSLGNIGSEAGIFTNVIFSRGLNEGVGVQSHTLKPPCCVSVKKWDPDFFGSLRRAVFLVLSHAGL